MPSINFRKSVFIASLLFILIAYFYIHNVTRDVYSGDIGDIATAAYGFGVPHPPGYPLLTLLGFFFSKLPLPLPVISKISLVSVISALMGTVVYFLFVLDTLQHFCSTAVRSSKSRSMKNAETEGTSYITIIAVFCTSVLAFSYMYWLYAEVPEVFALSNFLLIVIYYSSYRFSRTKNHSYLYVTALFVGFSLTNQQAILAVFPGVAVFILPGLWNIVKAKKHKKSIKQDQNGFVILAKVIGAFLLGLVPYAYVFISAATNPQINWLKEPTISNFIRLITRADYSFASDLIPVTQRLVVLGIYVTALVDEFSWIVIVLSCIGMITLYRENIKLFWPLFIGFFLSGPLFIFVIATGMYDQDQLGVLERFFMHSFILFLFFLPFGVFVLYKFFNRWFRKEIFAVILLLPLFVVPLQMIRFNSVKTDLSETKIGSALASDILTYLPKNAVVFLKSDSVTFNTWYAHYVLGQRKDVTLLSRAGDRTPFIAGILREYKAQHPQEKELPETQLLPRAITKLSQKRPVFSTYMFAVYSKNYIWLPRGLNYQLLALSNAPSKEEYKRLAREDIKRLHIPYRDQLQPAEQNIIAPNISRGYSRAAVAIGDTFLVYYKDPAEALTYYTLAKEIDGDNSIVYAKQGIVYSLSSNTCGIAVKYMEKAISMYKIYKPYYSFTFQVYDRCNVGRVTVNTLKRDYRELFGAEWEKDKQY